MHPTVPWLPPGELQADVFRDLQPDQNALSVYRADSDEDAIKIGVAIAATRRNFGNLDYAAIEESEIAAIGITPTQTDGETPSSEVNRLHRDLDFLTMDKLIRLARAISRSERNRIRRRRMERLLRSALQTGEFDAPDKINPDLRTKLSAA